MFLASAIDLLFTEGRNTYHVILKKNCDYILPANTKVVKSHKRNLYAIKIGEEYLCNGRIGFTEYSLQISEPVLFYDSCTAKTAFKLYWDDMYQPKSDELN